MSVEQCGFCGDGPIGSCGLHRFRHVGTAADYPPLRDYCHFFDPALGRQSDGVWVHPSVGALKEEHLVISQARGGDRVTIEWGMVPRLVAAIQSVSTTPCPHGVMGVRCDACYGEGLLASAIGDIRND